MIELYPVRPEGHNGTPHELFESSMRHAILPMVRSSYETVTSNARVGKVRLAFTKEREITELLNTPAKSLLHT